MVQYYDRPITYYHCNLVKYTNFLLTEREVFTEKYRTEIFL